VRLIEKLWTGDSGAHRIGRAALTPLEAIYRSAMAARDGLFERGIFSVAPSPIAVVSVGNLTVGGTGKTPVSAWLAGRLAEQGRKPAIVLRGYGDDEPIVHARLNPGIPVIVDRNRVRGIAEAAANGADVAVLDDAFQHRKAHRDVDILLVSADSWMKEQRVLPAGPYRESAGGLARASIVVITTKAAGMDRVAEVAEWVREVGPDKPVVVLRLAHSHLVREIPPPEAFLPLGALSGKRVLAIAAVGNPGAFFRQIEANKVTVVQLPFPDHHAFTTQDAANAVALAHGVDYVVCTLKDAVKLAPIWPATAAPLWYVSLSVEVESGEAAIDDMLRRLPGRGG
jgi:tetraacyldisaccharide 4'-kinase